MEETIAQIKELEQQIKTAEAKLQELVSGAEKVRQDYAELINWAKLFDNCNFEAITTSPTDLRARLRQEE